MLFHILILYNLLLIYSEDNSNFNPIISSNVKLLRTKLNLSYNPLKINKETGKLQNLTNKKLTMDPTSKRIPRSPAVTKIIKRIKNAKETPIQLR